MITFSHVDFAFRRSWRREQPHPVLTNFGWQVDRGDCVALVGASGSGKSTIVRLALGLLTPTAGSVRVAGIDPARARGAEARQLRRTIQWVSQHPDASFDPRMRIGVALGEVLAINNIPQVERRPLIESSIAAANLSARMLDRRPAELSGGELQRFAIARALLSNPEILLLDEPTSMLDVSVQAEIIRLLLGLKRDRKLTLVLVTHDLALAERAADRIDCLADGRITTFDQTESLKWTAPITA